MELFWFIEVEDLAFRGILSVLIFFFQFQFEVVRRKYFWLYRYFMGQLYEIATVFYKLDDITVRILESKNDNPGSTTSPLTLDTKTVFVKYRLDFDNRDYVRLTFF